MTTPGAQTSPNGAPAAGVPSPIATVALAQPSQAPSSTATPSPATTPAQQPAAAPAAPTPTQYTAEQVQQYQASVQAYYQQQLQAAQQQAQADMQLRIALARAGVHHDGYAEFLAGQYNGLAPTTRPKPEQWVEVARQQHAAMFAQGHAPATAAPMAAAPLGGAFPPPSAPGAPPAPAVAPPAPPGWAWNGQGWVPAAPAPMAPTATAAPFGWPMPVPQPPVAPPAWPPAAPAPTFQAPPPAAAPPGWPQLVRSNPDQGAPAAAGSPVDPPLSADLISRMDQKTFERRWTEIDAFMRARPRT